MSVTATVTSQQPITATVSPGGVIAASVPAAASVTATVSGGVGPQGAPGATGATGPAGSNTLASLTDVAINETNTGDVLRFSDGKWRDYPETSIVIDGENF